MGISAFGQIAIFASAAILVNYLAWKLNLWRSYQINPFLPPGIFIGVVWVVIFGIFGYIEYLLLDRNQGKASTASISVIILAIFCLLYPFLSNGSEKNARILNILSLFLTFVVGILIIGQCYENEVNLEPFFWLLPLLAWTSYVNLADSLFINRYVTFTYNS
jgi:tryptophan-rich sensory protein